MSTTSALRAPARPTPRTDPAETPRRHIEVVPSRGQRRARPRVSHALVAVAGVFAIIGAQLALSIALSGGAYQIGDLQDRQRELERVQQSLDEQLQIAGSTQRLATNASVLGMVPGGSQYYIDLGTGSLVEAPGMPNPFGCGAGCTLVPNSLAATIPLALAPAGAKVVGTVAKPAAGTTAPVVVPTVPVEGTTGGAADGAVAPVVVESPPVEPVPADAPPASGSIPGPVTH